MILILKLRDVLKNGSCATVTAVSGSANLLCLTSRITYLGICFVFGIDILVLLMLFRYFFQCP